jgi:hypothetical protein
MGYGTGQAGLVGVDHATRCGLAIAESFTDSVPLAGDTTRRQRSGDPSQTTRSGQYQQARGRQGGRAATDYKQAAGSTVRGSLAKLPKFTSLF